MTLPIATEEIVRMYLDEQMTEQKIAEKIGCSQQLVWSRLNRAGISVRRSNKRNLYENLKPHMQVLMSMLYNMRKRRKAMAEFVVDPRNPDHKRFKAVEDLVSINKEIAALEVVTRK